MKRSEYLYGVPALTWANLTYKEALKARIMFAEKHVEKLLAELNLLGSDVSWEEYQAISHQISEVKKAIAFNESLLKELYER